MARPANVIVLRVAGGLIVLAAVIVFLLSGNEKGPESGGQTTGKSPAAAREVKPGARGGDPRAGTSPASASQPMLDRIRAAADALGACGDSGAAAVILADLFAEMEAADPALVADACRRFLQSGVDAPTRIPFAVGEGGTLDGWPTLRVFLLDRLPSVDPESALDLSRRVMDEAVSADEYAIGLRNLAWSDLDGDLRDEFIRRFKSMAAREDWKRQPGAGFLEAVDAVVLLPENEGIAAALGLIGAGQPSLSRAAMMALDRIVERNPGVLSAWQPGDPLQPEQRASLMSRLDPTRADQLQVFANYLSGLGPGSELDVFSRLFPNGNQLHGSRMFSTPALPVSIGQRRENDRRILDAIRHLDFPAGSPAAGAIQRIRERLYAATVTDGGE